MKNSVLVIAAHPDDEILGCGATMALHARRGDEVNVVILAEGVTSRDPRRDKEARHEDLAALHDTARRASRLLGVRSLMIHEFPDNRMDSLDHLDVVKVIEDFLDRFRPSVIYTHHRGDVNIDHRLIHAAVVTACRPAPGARRVQTLLFFEVPSSTEWQPPASGPTFAPDWFVDISGTLDLKLRALREYGPEMRAWPHPRSLEAVEHLARWRGAAIGTTAAEAFELGRHIIVTDDEDRHE